MSESQQFTPPPLTNSDDGSFIVDGYQQASSSQSKSDSGWHDRLLHRRRWMVILSAALIVLAMSGGLLLAYRLSTTENNPTPQITPNDSQQANQAQKPTKDSDDDPYFASQELTFAYYSFAQTNNNRNIFQSMTNQSESRFLDIGSPTTYSFANSPDGRQLARWNEQALEVSQSVTPSDFESLLVLPKKNSQITSVLWSPDSKSILVSSSQPDEKDSSIKVSTIERVSIADGKSVTLWQKDVDFVYELRAWVNNRWLLYVEDRSGLKRNLTEIDTKKKKISRQLHFISQAALNKMTFDQSFSRGLTIEGDNLVLYNLTDGQKTNLYKVNRQCLYDQVNQSRITTPLLSPDGKTALFMVIPDACPNQSAQTDLRPYLATLNVKDKKVSRKAYDVPFSSVDSLSWSPKADWLWIQADDQTSYLLEMAPMKFHPVPPTDRQVLTKERVVFLAWLRGKSK